MTMENLYDVDFFSKKKKHKKKKNSALLLLSNNNDQINHQSLEKFGDLTISSSDSIIDDDQAGISSSGGGDYSYDELLKLAFSKMTDVQVAKKKFKIKNPKAYFCGKKTIYRNFTETCWDLNRDPRHVSQFFSVEFDCILPGGNKINRDGELILNKNISYEAIKRCLLEYVNSYVKCKTCGDSSDTKLQKDSKARLYCISCRSCGANFYPESMTQPLNYYQHSFIRKK